jgi:hypothetical protein
MMTRDEVIAVVKESLVGYDSYGTSILVNFVDDEIDWEMIAKIAVGAIESTIEEVPWVQQ